MFQCWRKPEHLEETTDLRKMTAKGERERRERGGEGRGEGEGEGGGERERASEPNKQSQALHKNLYSAAAFKKSKITSGLTVLKRSCKEGTW